MHGYRTNTEYTGSLGYNSVYRKIRTHVDLLSLLHYILDRMGVTEGDLSIGLLKKKSGSAPPLRARCSFGEKNKIK